MYFIYTLILSLGLVRDPSLLSPSVSQIFSDFRRPVGVLEIAAIAAVDLGSCGFGRRSQSRGKTARTVAAAVSRKAVVVSTATPTGQQLARERRRYRRPHVLFSDRSAVVCAAGSRSRRSRNGHHCGDRNLAEFPAGLPGARHSGRDDQWQNLGQVLRALSARPAMAAAGVRRTTRLSECNPRWTGGGSKLSAQIRRR